MSARRCLAGGLARGVLAGSCAAVLVALGGPAAAAAPAPPSNPSDAVLNGVRHARDDAAGRVAELANELAEAESRLTALGAEVEARAEAANKAMVDLQLATEAADRAMREALAARRQADAAGEAIEQARRAVDEFASASFRQGSTVGSITAYLGATSPRDLLARAGLLNAVSGSTLNALEQLERSRAEKANKDSAARAALDQAQRLRAVAEQAKRHADAARAVAEQALREQSAKAATLEAAKADVERRLAEAQARVSGLESQRRRYEDWLEAKRREDDRLAAQAAVQAAVGGGVRVAINRALSQVGVEYAWGGGDADGPTRGIRDGGVADAHGDYRKVGFDCSGLMIYAFAGVGVRLPHYSGYQATAGREVPLSEIRPGDLLFWADGGEIHHVALYLGNGQMIEAPHSGGRVRVTPVRYGGIVPRATRLL